MEENRFRGRSLAVINDYSQEERLYLFEKTKELKNLFKAGKKEELKKYRIDDSDFGVYEVFLESSTRTKESFKNAAEFHRIKISNLDVGASSINKKESYADTFNTLAGYNNSIFIVRSKLEGVCRWLEINGKAFAKRNGLPCPPSFINAGDGKHEHPTQELLDEYTFLEKNNWKRDSIHLVLIGDLYHGRTVHSKVQGLKIFNNVYVDLIAPPELALPAHYISEMKTNGYRVRTFDSIETYLQQEQIADKWYFTRPQLERMGDDILKIADSLRAKISFRQEFLQYLPEKTVFYHPLPRHKEHPTIPTFLDSTSLNGWEEQSINGKLIRIILLGLTAGKLGDDFNVKEERVRQMDKLFIEELAIDKNRPLKRYAEGVNPISHGIVIDHICRGEDKKEIRAHMVRIINVMELFGKGGEWITASRENPDATKGIIFRPDREALTESEINKLAAIAPGSTVNIINNSKIIKKIRLYMPPRVYNLDSINCKNDSCISYPSHGENIPAEFFKISENTFVCRYCEKVHTFKEIWK
jgi:aspartate carbamoyltransferase